MKGFRVSTGKKKIVYVYENIITPEERETVRQYYLPAGYKIETRVKDVKATKARAEKNGFTGEATRATKQEMLTWIEENDPASLRKWYNDFKPKKEGGKGFAKAKAEFKKEYPNYTRN